MSGGDPTSGPLTSEELQLATRNHGMPLEALRYEITPTGMHYLLVHFDIPHVDPETWRLEIGGNVDAPRSLGYADLAALPSTTLPVTMECAGNGRARLTPRPISQPWLVEAVGTALWTGVPLHDVVSAAGIRSDTAELVFRGADNGVQGGEKQEYERSLPLAEALRPEVLLAYEMNARPLEPQHGAPVRLVVPGWYGMTSVKWLVGITAVSEPFQGYQQREAYRYQQDADDPGERVDRIRVRALMAPPGYPDFLTRTRFIEAGEVELSGRAWSGSGAVERVEVGVDGVWKDAELDSPIGDFAWRGWHHLWRAEPGEHVVSCRATDASGEVQPLEQPWNYQGMGNNLVQTLPVSVSSR